MSDKREPRRQEKEREAQEHATSRNRQSLQGDDTEEKFKELQEMFNKCTGPNYKMIGNYISWKNMHLKSDNQRCVWTMRYNQVTTDDEVQPSHRRSEENGADSTTGRDDSRKGDSTTDTTKEKETRKRGGPEMDSSRRQPQSVEGGRTQKRKVEEVIDVEEDERKRKIRGKNENEEKETKKCGKRQQV